MLGNGGRGLAEVGRDLPRGELVHSFEDLEDPPSIRLGDGVQCGVHGGILSDYFSDRQPAGCGRRFDEGVLAGTLRSTSGGGHPPRVNAIRIDAHGGPEVLRYRTDLPDPAPGPGRAVVRIEAAGVNFIDVYQREGHYPVPTPFVPGQEAAGVVEAVGSGVHDVRAGDRVAWAGPLGAYAERAAVPADRLVPVPEGISARQAAAAMLQGMTAHYLASSTFPLAAGDTCLVHAAAGGVGLLLCQVAKMRGARVIGTVSTAEKEALARAAGADLVIRYDRTDFEEETKRLTDGAGVKVVYDSVGKITFEKGLRVLARRGMMVLFGQSSGSVGELDPQILNRHGALYLTRPSLGHYTATRAELLARAAEVLGWIRDGALTLRIGLELPLARAAEAHQKLEARQTTGKVLLLP